MKSAAENLSPTRVKLNVEVTLDELKPNIDAAYKSVAEQIQVPGFRKGKVPSRLIDQRVGRGYVLETAINEGLNDWYQQAVAETGTVSTFSFQPGIDSAAVLPSTSSGSMNVIAFAAGFQSRTTPLRSSSSTPSATYSSTRAASERSSTSR